MNSHKELEKIFKAVGNQRRLAILAFLKKKKQASVGQITEHLNISFKSTSKHIARLYSADLVEREQIKFEMHYSISYEQHQVIATLLKLL